MIKVKTTFYFATFFSVLILIMSFLTNQILIGSIIIIIIIIVSIFCWKKRRREELEKRKEIEEKIEMEKEKEIVIEKKKGDKYGREGYIKKLKDELENLKKTKDLLEEEYKEGVITLESYKELKKENKEATLKIRGELAKLSGKNEKLIFCPKGKHYLLMSEIKPHPKLKGYVICPEHNEDIRIE